MSKQPFVKIIFLFFVLRDITKLSISSKFFIKSSVLSLWSDFLYSSISANEAVALPTFPTTTPAAKFANSAASIKSIPTLTPYPKAASTVSPAPVTSYTSFATVGIFLNPFENIAIPSSLRVIITFLSSHSSLSFNPTFCRLSSSDINKPVAVCASSLLGVIKVAPLYLL